MYLCFPLSGPLLIASMCQNLLLALLLLFPLVSGKSLLFLNLLCLLTSISLLFVSSLITILASLFALPSSRDFGRVCFYVSAKTYQ